MLQNGSGGHTGYRASLLVDFLELPEGSDVRIKLEELRTAESGAFGAAREGVAEPFTADGLQESLEALETAEAM